MLKSCTSFFHQLPSFKPTELSKFVWLAALLVHRCRVVITHPVRDAKHLLLSIIINQHEPCQSSQLPPSSKKSVSARCNLYVQMYALGYCVEKHRCHSCGAHGHGKTLAAQVIPRRMTKKFVKLRQLPGKSMSNQLL